MFFYVNALLLEHKAVGGDNAGINALYKDNVGALFLL